MPEILYLNYCLFFPTVKDPDGLAQTPVSFYLYVQLCVCLFVVFDLFQPSQCRLCQEQTNWNYVWVVTALHT